MVRRLGSVVMAAVAGAMMMGCAVHLPSNSKVAFDYSDYASYDRGYAPSSSATQPEQAANQPQNAAQGQLEAVTSDEEFDIGR